MAYVTQKVNMVYIQEQGCCSLRSRCFWVAGYNMVAGLISFIFGAINLADHAADYPAIGGIQLGEGIFLIAASAILIFGVIQKNNCLLTVWLVIISLFLGLAAAGVGLCGYALALLTGASSSSGLFPINPIDFPTAAIITGIALGALLIGIVIQIACIVTVTSFKKRMLMY